MKRWKKLLKFQAKHEDVFKIREGEYCKDSANAMEKLKKGLHFVVIVVSGMPSICIPTSSYDNNPCFSLSVVVIYREKYDNEWQGILGILVIAI